MNLSIVITTCRRPDSLRRALFSVLSQNHPGVNLDLLVVDDDSAETGRKIITEFTGGPEVITYLSSKGRGPSTARNLGIKKSRNNNVLLLDDDVEMLPDYLINLVRTLRRYPQAVVIGGRNIAVFPSQPNKLKIWLARFPKSPWLFAHTYFLEKSVSKILLYQDVYSSNMYIRKDKISNGESVFDAQLFGRKYGNHLLFGEDYELCLRLMLHKFEILYDPKLVCLHHISASRLNYFYIYSRLFSAGCVQRITDQKFSNFRQYSGYKFRFAEITKKTLPYSERLGRIILALGYYYWKFRKI